MIKIGVRELKNQLSQILQKVRDEGEVVEITYYGQRIAHLVHPI
jgi:prevent-host-death family protein